mmetsp:Transcript_39995/g.41675  ORF Transcript_39995/g.41675 Transcript_39995/m.41675 type:complete len:279 (+) Transcript_39995:1-837(+)
MRGNKETDYLYSNTGSTSNTANAGNSGSNIEDEFLEEDKYDEEEELINNEFKKTNQKKDKDEFLFENIDHWNINEDDEEERKRKEELVKTNKNQKEDRLEKLFNLSEGELRNYFSSTSKGEEKAQAENSMVCKDVFYNSQKKKLIVSKSALEEKGGKKNDSIKESGSNPYLSKKRKKNIMKDADDSDNEDEKMTKQKKQASNSNSNKYSSITAPSKDREGKNSHFVKFSGKEYESKSGQGDVLKGKYEPFAYVQLNPKAADKKNKDNVKLFDKLINPK